MLFAAEGWNAASAAASNPARVIDPTADDLP
jgi:hypothetical protein